MEKIRPDLNDGPCSVAFPTLGDPVDLATFLHAKASNSSRTTERIFMKIYVKVKVSLCLTN